MRVGARRRPAAASRDAASGCGIAGRTRIAANAATAERAGPDLTATGRTAAERATARRTTTCRATTPWAAAERAEASSRAAAARTQEADASGPRRRHDALLPRLHVREDHGERRDDQPRQGWQRSASALAAWRAVHARVVAPGR